MSSASARRIKERSGGGGGGQISAAPAEKVSPVTVRSVSAGKQNPRPTSRVQATTQKPTLRPMARVDKSAVTGAAPAADESRSRWSISSVPRGRSTSPSEFTRVMSGLRRNSSSVIGSARGKENSVSLKGLNGKPIEKSDRDKRFGKDLAKNVEFLEYGSQKKDRVKIRAVNNGRSDVKEEILGLVAMETPTLEKKVLKDLKKNGGGVEDAGGEFSENERVVTVLNGDSEELELNSIRTSEKRSDLDETNLKCSSEIGDKSIRVAEGIKVKPSPVGVQSGSSSRESKMVNRVSNSAGAMRENVAANKYPSKLHEKLAFLEGKVKRIASDIKKTKEILDLNNADASKMMLSDIQDKITGIEKAMVSVTRGEQIQVEKDENEVKDAKRMAKGLNSAELEARLFPHHKLIRDRTLSKSTSEIRVLEVGESMDEKAISFKDKAIAVEFLASLSKEESHNGEEVSKLQEMDDSVNSTAEGSSLAAVRNKVNLDALLMADETLNEFDDEENGPVMMSEDELEENYTYKLSNIGHKTSTGGWFVSEGESVLLAHDDGSCSFYDIANSEEKAEYKPPAGVSPNMWQDCWIIRAPSADGCSGRYVVAASAGKSTHSGFCSWDFYTKKIHAYRFEDETTHANNKMHGRLGSLTSTESQQWWYKPCGPLIMSASSCSRSVQIFDIRDGEEVMKWNLQKPLSSMDYSSPLQWRNRGKVVIAELDAISLWDVSSLNSQALLSVSSSGRKISALHVNNTDAELGGGVRQRVSSAEAEGNDGVFTTSDSINVLDFRLPSGIALKMPKVGTHVHSSFSRGDSIYIGCSSLKSAAKKQYSSQIQHFSLRKERLFSTYTLPESNADNNFTTLTQVWGNSSYVMGVCGAGLFVFDSMKDDGVPSSTMDYSSSEIIGRDDMCCLSFDYLSSRVMLISKDRPAQWRYLF